MKFTKQDRTRKTVLVPNTSHAFSRVMAAAFYGQGIRAVPLEVGGEEAIRLGKKYVHNDICFPAQVVIGEALAALKSGKYDPKNTAIGMGKYIGDCRLTHYSSLLRKALDDAGFPEVPILTNDDTDSHNLHPGFRQGIEYMKQVPYDRSCPRPRVLIVGEYLLNFHPGANHEIEKYLEQNGFEVIEARMTDVIRKTYFYQDAQIREYHVKRGAVKKTWFYVADHIFDLAHEATDRIARNHPLYHPACRMQDLVKESDPVIHHTFDAGEGVLIPGEILHHAKEAEYRQAESEKTEKSRRYASDKRARQTVPSGNYS